MIIDAGLKRANTMSQSLKCQSFLRFAPYRRHAGYAHHRLVIATASKASQYTEWQVVYALPDPGRILLPQRFYRDIVNH